MTRILLCIWLVVALTPMPSFAQSACDRSVSISVASGTTTELVALLPSTSIYVCGFVVTGDTAATTVQFRTGTGTTCGTGTVNLTGAIRMGQNTGVVYGGGNGLIFRGNPDSALCIVTATGAVTGVLTYRQG